MRIRLFCAALAAIAMAAMPLKAQPLAGPALAGALRNGGYVLVMRHANSPAMPPDKANADPENTGLERQLDTLGRDTARAMGESLKALGIPVGEVLSSPTYRARLTVRLAAFGTPRILGDLDEGAAGMAANAEKAKADFLRGLSAKVPLTGTNTLIVSHAPNIQAAFGKDADAIASGETLVFRPGAGKAELIARVKIGEWPGFAGK